MNKSSLWKMVSAVAVVAVGICVASGGAFAGQDDNRATSSPSAVVPLTTPKATNGSVKCTANINSDGSVLACKHCNPSDTTHVATGEYSVGFNKPCQNILAVNGWSRWVQVDTLAFGTAHGTCTTADRVTDANAVWVACFDGSGNPADASFFLFVAK